MFNPFAGFIDGIKKKIVALDVNHDGHPDLQEIKTEFEAVEAGLAPLAAKLTPADLTVLLNTANAALGNKFTAAEITAASTAILSAGPTLAKLEAFAAEAAKTLGV